MNNGLSVFISHSTLDKSFVERLKPFLESIGVRTFVDNYEIVGGDEIIERIVDEIYRYDFFCLVLSPRAEKSVWVRRESVMALWRWVQDLKMARSFFIPILREDCIIWEGVRDLLHIDFRLDGEFGTRCDELKNAILKPNIETLLTFEEGQVILADLLPSVTDELRWFALDKMKGSHREPCVAIAKQIMNHEEKADGEKMKAAKLLIELQVLDGLRFFVLRVKETKRALLAYPEESTLRNIASRDAIPLLMDLLEATYMDGFLDNRHFSIHNIIQGALTNITLTKLRAESLILLNGRKRTTMMLDSSMSISLG